jgi:hypothetical protein
MKGMMDLYERAEDRKAQQAFNVAFAKMQKVMPRIEATKAVPDKHGNIKYKYAPYEEIMAKAQPYLTRFGFSVSFDVAYQEGDRVAVTTILKHVGGHKERNTFACRVGAGPIHSSEPQADGSAKTVAKRNSLCDALNIVVEHDDDARNLGSPISAAKAEELKKRVRNLEVSEMGFLRYAGADDFEGIMTSRLEELESWLDKAAAKRKAAGQ